MEWEGKREGKREGKGGNGHGGQKGYFRWHGRASVFVEHAQRTLFSAFARSLRKSVSRSSGSSMGGIGCVIPGWLVWSMEATPISPSMC